MEGAQGRGAGYRYFGAAKNLPGVKELFEKEEPKIVRKTRFQVRFVDACNKHGRQQSAAAARSNSSQQQLTAAARSSSRQQQLAACSVHL